MYRSILILFSLVFAASCAPRPSEQQPTADVVLIGAGIMSATLGTMLKELDPNLSMEIYERLDKVAAESSDALNNAGTGHSGFCELNYTPELADGTIETKKAVAINEQFEISKQFWSYQVQNKYIADPRSFINSVPHMSFVWGDKNVDYLRKRYLALQKENLFKGMMFSDNHEQLKSWIPLVMKNRDPQQKVAATRMEIGTDVNFGSLTRQLINHLTDSKRASVFLKHEVEDLYRNDDKTWSIVVKDLERKHRKIVKAKFVFIGAGGGALRLLEKSDIPESRGYGGVPVGGEWLVTTNPELIEQHNAKVYGMTSVGSPPMSVPHLDTRVINGEKALLFGPFATFSTKFLKNGSWTDLFASLNTGNILPMMQAGLNNIPLIRYLVSQLMLNPTKRLDALREYFPDAKIEDWKLEIAGQRVQIVKKDAEDKGILQFGTEVVGSEDGSIVALLGASPGASTAAPIMLKVIEKSFKDRLATPLWQARIRQMVPSYGQALNTNPALLNQVRGRTGTILGIKTYTVPSRKLASTEK